MEEIISTKLENGLQVNLKEIHTAPIISHWLWYRVGSRDELPGKTGISHWVEHMQFKGTKKFPAGVLDKTISRVGGIWNAFTFMDWTAYFETLPSDHIDLAMELEVDRMQNSLFEHNEVESERTVVMAEREGNENEPLFRLGEAVQMVAFDRHPYRNEVIGSMEDLHAITRDNLFDHYKKYYNPANAVLCLSGDFNANEMLDKVKRYYNDIPSGETNNHSNVPEFALDGQRDIVVNGPGETMYLQIVFRAPEASNLDFQSLSVLDSLLTGPSGLNMFGGGGVSNKTSRLYKSLVESQLATGISGGVQATKEPFLYNIMAMINPEKNINDVIQVIDEEINKIIAGQVKINEIERAIKQAQAMFVYGSENITNQAFWLGYAEMFADYDWFLCYLDRLRSITPEQIIDTARKYLNVENRIVGKYIPDERHA